MGLQIFFVPVIGLGFVINILIPLVEIVIGPMIIRFGDLSRIEGEDEDVS
jgi:hypothetical protein